jgi:hypothetical protein
MLIQSKPAVGSRLHSWTVLGDVERIYKTHWGMRCRCECGAEKVVALKYLLNGASKSCGRCNIKDPEIGERFSRWVVKGVPRTVGHGRKVACLCDCGTIRDVRLDHLASGVSTSCGCYRDQNPGGVIHGESRTRLHWIWCGIRQRCHDKNCGVWKYYGGRGITICKEWDESYESFRDWSKANGYCDGLVIDRIDTNGNYEPGNCRWITQKENSRNARSNRNVIAFGETKCASAWAEDSRCQVSYQTFIARLNRGWDSEDALSKPLRSRTKQCHRVY